MDHSSNQNITVSWLGLSHKDLLKLGSTAYKLTPELLEGIFGLEVEKIQEIYSQAGLCKPYIEPLSMEAFYCCLLWMYITGRCNFGLNAYGKIEWLISEKDDRIGLMYAKTSLHAMTGRLRALTGISKNELWLLRYLAKTLLHGLPNDRRGALSDILVSNRKTLVRHEYKPIDAYLDLDKLNYQRRKLFFSKLQFHCILDRIRIEACHVYKGNREDIAYVIRGSETRAKTVLPKLSIPLPVLGEPGVMANAFIKSLKLKGKIEPMDDDAMGEEELPESED